MKTKLMMVGSAFITFFIAASLSAQAPQLLNYQGKLANNDGTAAAGTFALTFSIYPTKSGGTALWTETQTVTITNGVFNVLLGSVTPLVNRLTNKGLFAEAGERYLGIKVGADPEMTPRFQLTSVAYAIKSSQADKATTADTARVALSTNGAVVDGHSLDAADGDPKDVVFVDTAGRVGIGTKSPQYLLHLLAGNVGDGGFGDGALVSESFPADDNKEAISSIGLINRGKGGTRYRWTLLTAAIAAPATLDPKPNAFEIWEYPRLGIGTPPGEKFGPRFKILPSVNETTFPSPVVINSKGNVGIGTVDPKAKLHVAGGLRAQKGDPLAGDDSNIGYAFEEDGDTGMFATGGSATNNSYLGFKIDNIERLRITHPGNIGIGTTTPQRKFQIDDDIAGIGIEGKTSETSAGAIRFGDNTGWKFHIGRSRESSAGALNSGVNGALMTIQDNGNVGIGTPNPQVKLDVAGEFMLNRGLADGARIIWRGGPNNVQEYRARVSDGGELQFFPGEGTLNTLSLSQTGKVGIGKGSDSQFSLDVNGPVRATSFTPPSDLRYKKNIAAIPNAIDKVTRLRGVSFDWRQEEFPELNFSPGRNLGFIAQEIKEVLPEVVSQDSKGYYSVAYSNVVPVLVEAIKEQQQTIAQLQTQLQKNEAELAGFKEKMSRIEVALQKLAVHEKTDRSLAATGQ